MNKLILYFALFGLFLNFASSQMYYKTDAIHEDHPDKCYHEPTKHIFSPGEQFNPRGYCTVLYCDAPGRITGKSCDLHFMPQCKKLDLDLTRPYPFCCQNFLCTDLDGKEYIYNPNEPTTH